MERPGCREQRRVPGDGQGGAPALLRPRVGSAGRFRSEHAPCAGPCDRTV